jgi:ATP-dependent Lon protease
MEIIRLPGYTEYEKYNIAKDFLIPKQIKINGMEGKNIQFSKNSVLEIIQRYTREAGVRNLEREIASVCRKLAKEYMRSDEEEKTFRVTAMSIAKYLGPPRFRVSQVEDKDLVGTVNGLAWTQFGGELLMIETLIMPGKGEVSVTGKLGDVMKESAQAAVSYVRSRADYLMIDNTFHKNFDIHIHIPEGAIPKDGPSAGITMCTSLVSALTKRPVYRDVAMTGEITLRGRVLPIGGLKEKIIAAHRAGIKKIIIPKENEKDLTDIPQGISKQVNIVSVEHMDEVLTHALVTEEGESLFRKDDILPYEVMAREVDNRPNGKEQPPLM